MKTSIIPFFNFLIFALPYLVCGATLVEQGKNVNLFSKIFVQFSSFIHASIVTVILAPILALYLMRLCAAWSVHIYKKAKFYHQQQKIFSSHIPLLWIMRFVSVALAFSTQLILCSFKVWENLFIDLGSKIVIKLSLYSPQYAELLQNNGGRLAHSIFCIALSIFMLWISIWIYNRIRHLKHGPIFKEYYIHGRINGIIGLLWTSAKVKGFGLGLKGEDVVGVPEDTIFTESITSKDWRQHSKKKYTMAFRERFIPHLVKSQISIEQVKAVIEHLKAALSTPNEELLGKKILPLIKSSHIFDALKHGDLTPNTVQLSAEGLSTILQMLTQEKGHIDLLDLDKFCKKVNQGARLYDFGGMFLCQLYENRDGNFTPTTKLRENLQKTLDITTAKDGYGDQYLEKGEVLVALTFTSFGSIDDIPDEEVADGHEHGNERNTIVEYRKTWFHTVMDGFGRAYMFYHGNAKYIYDEWWAGSFKIFNNPFAQGPKERALRRIGYVRRAGGKIVAKIEDTQVLFKCVGSYNRKIHIYDHELANDDAFGTLMCCFSQFLTHQQSYRQLRLQQSLPLSIGYSGGDIDASQH
jgi:hypothetical protein